MSYLAWASLGLHPRLLNPPHTQLMGEAGEKVWLGQGHLSYSCVYGPKWDKKGYVHKDRKAGMFILSLVASRESLR